MAMFALASVNANEPDAGVVGKVMKARMHALLYPDILPARRFCGNLRTV